MPEPIDNTAAAVFFRHERSPGYGRADPGPPDQLVLDGWSIPGFMHTWFCVTQLRQVALL
jgi:hypothetical protein